MPDKKDPEDSYEVYTNGHDKDVFLKHPNGAEFIGQVWPGSAILSPSTSADEQTDCFPRLVRSKRHSMVERQFRRIPKDRQIRRGLAGHE